IWRFAARLRHGKSVKNETLYKDRDGAANEKSMAAYQTKHCFAVIFVALGLGSASSLTLVVLGTVYHVSNITPIWLLFWSWILSLLQVLDTFTETQIVTRSKRGVTSGLSFLLVALSAGILISSENLGDRQSIGSTVTLTAQICTALAIVVAFGLIKRRPDVFTPDGRPVERQFTSSLWTRYSYNWSSDLLDLAATKLIESPDLPAMDAHVRAADAKEAFKSIALKPDVSLWLQVFWAFRWQITFQWLMVIASSILDSAPSLAMFQLLRYLEARTEFDAIDHKAWLCVAALLVATLAETLVDYRVNWLMWSEIGVPIRASLTTLIYEKMMKIKDCKEPPKDDSKKSDDANKAFNGMGQKPSGPDKDAAKKQEATKKADQSQQDIINMFAVDTNQVGVFGAVNQFYVMFASKFVVSVVFLWLLVGWESLAAGMVAIVIAYPFNKIFATRYGSFQKKLMKARDKKTKIISEALQGIRQIKFSAVETEWAEKINTVRDDELALLWQTKLNNLYMTLCGDIAPIFLTVFALATYAYIYGDLLPSVAFTALGVFMQLEGVLGMVPFLFMMGMNAKVSCDRIDAFLRSAEKPENTHPGDSIAFDRVSVSFPSKSNAPQEANEGEGEGEDGKADENRFILRDLNLRFPNRSLSVILGPTGSGKSLLLAAILGEVDVLEGNITVPRPPSASKRFDSKATAADWILSSSIAYVAQTPWIENASIKDNILFGLPLDEVRYGKVLEACALMQDLDLFDDGDLTEVGAQGISLSGGQKWRLTLARALYSRAGILVLDDVFSALDAHVGKQIYDNALMGELSEGRTRVLATHHASLCLSRAEYAVCLSAGGALEHAGLVKEFQRSPDFGEILKAVKEDVKQDQTQESGRGVPNANINGSAAKADKPPKKLVEDEKRETGSVKRSVYVAYLKATGGIPFWSFIFTFYIIAQALTLSRSWWIKIWTSSYDRAESVGREFYVYPGETQFAKFNAPLPTNQTSISLPGFGILASASMFSMRSLLSALRTEDVWAIIILALILLGICGRIALRYIRGARSIKRLESIQKSPMISHFTASLQGLSTIRAFAHTAIFETRMHALIDSFTSATWHNWLFNTWVGFRMAMTGSIFSTLVAAFVISSPTADASLGGFALAFAMSYRQTVNMTLRLLASCELDMNAAERIFEYSSLDVESEAGVEIRASWPETGELQVKDLEIGYAEGLPSIIKGLTFHVEMNQRIGVVGRTGAGKSTLSLALFRFLEARKGSIVIDGVDISTIKLHELRTRLAIIPQDPVLFSGTIRSNLDPFDEFSDFQLRQALQRVHLVPSTDNTPVPEPEIPVGSSTADALSNATSTTAAEPVVAVKENSNIFLSLSSPISSSGANLSQGQKQLLCLARAILSRPKILLLDEATSAVDKKTDTLIQRSIREEFSNTTLLVVAHRLSTVMDFDKILVMKDGAAAEFDAPRELLNIKNGVFRGMVSQNGEKDELTKAVGGV
ncbi:P-loop containing nucleoside triphosphate hydrolase protein, partial [Diplocarpon rosae]